MKSVIIAIAVCTVACRDAATDGERARRIGVALPATEHAFIQQLESGLHSRAGKIGFQLLIRVSDADLSEQLDALDNFVSQHVDAIILCPVDPKSIAPAIQRAEAAGIPVFTLENRLFGLPVTSHIGSDSFEGGQIAARYVASAIGESGAVGVMGRPDVQPEMGRQQGFASELSKHPRVRLVASPNDGGVRTRAFMAADQMLQAHPDLAGIFATNDESALGALAAVRAHRKTASTFVIVGFDGSPDAMAAIRAQTPLKADIVQDPLAIGERTIDAVASYFAGQAVDSAMLVPVRLVDTRTRDLQ